MKREKEKKPRHWTWQKRKPIFSGRVCPKVPQEAPGRDQEGGGEATLGHSRVSAVRGACRLIDVGEAFEKDWHCTFSA